MDISPLSYSVRGACNATGWSRSLIYLKIKEGSLQSYLIGSRRFITREKLEKAVEEAAADLTAESAVSS
jgi:excisionase family DNA binding protein